jgi:uncharacterized protein
MLKDSQVSNAQDSENINPICSESLDSSVLSLTLEHGKGVNWVHRSLGVGPTKDCGLGTIALDDIEEGTLLVVYGGQVFTLEEFELLSTEMQSFPYQVDENLFLGPRDLTEIGIGERINHSCEPNSGFRGSIHVVALRDIRRGEQITFDYATCVSAEHDVFVMQCKCGCSTCRGVITGEDWRIPELYNRLLDFYQPYLQNKVKAILEEIASTAPIPSLNVRHAHSKKKGLDSSIEVIYDHKRVRSG